MSFREKSAWAMGVVILLTGLLLAATVLHIPANAPAQALVLPLVPYVIAVVIGSIVVQAALAIVSPGDAKKPADERERVAIDRAGHWSGVVLGVGVVSGLLNFLWYGEGQVLFLWCLGALILAQLAEYVFQIVLFRRGG